MESKYDGVNPRKKRFIKNLLEKLAFFLTRMSVKSG